MDAEWVAGWTAARRRRILFLTGLPALALTLVGTLGPFVVAATWLPNLVVVGGAWLVLASLVTNRRTYRTTSDGLEREGRLRTRTYRWDELAGYEVTDGAIVIHRKGVWPAIRCALADIEDVDAVRAALDRHL